MIYSSERKLCLSGWLSNYHKTIYDRSLKLQKFLLLYEVFSKVEDGDADFDNLRGYKRGPVFSKVWGDYTKERNDFDLAAQSAFLNYGQTIDQKRAERSAFIVSSLTESELSELSHQLNIWKIKKAQILSGKKQVPLEEEDFNSEDRELISILADIYPDELIESSQIIPIDSKFFVISKSQMQLLNEEHYDVLSQLASQNALRNPVFIEIDEEGRIIVD